MRLPPPARRPAGLRHAAVATAATLLVACNADLAPTAPPAALPQPVVVVNDPATLAKRVTVLGGDALTVDTAGRSAAFNAARTAGGPAAAGPRFAVGAAPAALQFLARARVTPPAIAGRALEATHITVAGGYAYVGYGVAGETAAGAVDVYDVQNPGAPRLVSQATFADMDVSAVAVDRGVLYVAGSQVDASLGGRAVLDAIPLTSTGRLTTQSTRLYLPSYRATDVAVSNNTIYVTSGTGGPVQGGLSLIDRATFTITSTDRFDDARAVAADTKRVVVVQGQPGRVRVYDAKAAYLGTVATGGASIAESKATLALVGDWALVSAGDGGAKVVDLAARKVASTIDRPIALGIDQADAVTNGATYLNFGGVGLALLANGGAGVYLAFDVANARATAPTFALFGRLVLPAATSTNVVASDGSSLFVATGRGGLTIIEVPQGGNN